jgi:hypothetical protein
MSLIKWLLMQKFGIVILIVVGVILLISLVRNILSGSFNVAKFAGGFNLFTGSIQGKLMYYAVFAILAFGLYHQLTRATFDTDYTNTYKNNIHGNENVTVDQSQHIQTPEDALLIGIKIFGFKLGVSVQSQPKPVTIIDNSKINQKSKITPVVIPKKEKKVDKISIFKKVWKTVVFPINIVKKIIK